ncbi:MAG: hypothetical protein HYU39_06330 [Thaumarchaeota archaeon]|nr:hypothetical protein [Nitrososphaerota archaeon]
MDCILCGKEMFFDKINLTYVCLNEQHGVLAFFTIDQCYFTSRQEVGEDLIKRGHKYHLIPEDVLAMLDVKK